MRVIERNVVTGEVTERDYNQEELDAIAIKTINSANKKIIRDKLEDINTKRTNAIEEILISSDSVKAKAYQDAIK